MKKIAVINDISGFGKCSLSAALPIISAHGIQCCPLPTGVFSNQTGYDSYTFVDLGDKLGAFAEEWKKLNARFDAILTGFILNSAQADFIESFVDSFKSEHTLLVVDPIMGDDSEVYDCYDEKSIESVKRLAERADIITPNVTELALLCNRDIKADCTPDDIYEMSRTLNNSIVITTGILIGDSEIANAVYDGECFKLVKSKRLGEHFSGTGDIFSAFITAQYLCHGDIFKAVENATEFIEEGIKETLRNSEELHYHPDGIDFETVLSRRKLI